MLKRELFLISGEDNQETVVYTDSMFWCGPDLVKSMLEFAEQNKDELYKTETCIYGDFMACMGSRKREEKLYWKKISAAAPIKTKIANHFQCSPLSVLVLEKSKFYHIGTMPEYLENLCQSSELFSILGMKTILHCHSGKNLNCRGIILDSVVDAAVEVGEGSVVDHCIFHTPLIVESNTILSNCVINGADIDIIPSGWLFHSSAILKDGQNLYVTIAFRLDENLKTCTEHSWKHLAEENSSLWTAHLFKASATMRDSFSSTWRSVTRNNQVDRKEDDIVRYSMMDIVKLKRIEGFLQHRANIYQLCSSWIIDYWFFSIRNCLFYSSVEVAVILPISLIFFRENIYLKKLVTFGLAQIRPFLHLLFPLQSIF